VSEKNGERAGLTGRAVKSGVTRLAGICLRAGASVSNGDPLDENRREPQTSGVVGCPLCHCSRVGLQPVIDDDGASPYATFRNLKREGGRQTERVRTTAESNEHEGRIGGGNPAAWCAT
jgi:hypothetical protein